MTELTVARGVAVVLSPIMPGAGPERMAYGATRGVEKTNLDRALRLRLAVAARRTGLSQAALISGAVDAYLGRVDRERVPSWVGAVTDAPITDAATIKQELRPAWLERIEARDGEGGA